MADPKHINRRVATYWRTLAQTLPSGEDSAERVAGLEGVIAELAADLDLPPLLLDRRASMSDLLRRFPDLASEMESLIPSADAGEAAGEAAAGTEAEADADIDQASVRRAVLYSKLLQNVFGGQGDGNITAKQYSQWLDDVGHFERCFGYAPGELRSGRGRPGRGLPGPSMGPDTKATGVAPELGEGDVAQAMDEIARGRGLMSEPEIQASLAGMEKQLINRMALREVLKDAKLAAKLTPSIALVEQLLRDKRHLQGPALANAKQLIRRYVADLADLLKREVQSTPTGKIDYSVPPKRVFRNLDLRRTIWKNLINYNPEDRRLYVDKLFYRHSAGKTNKTRLIVVVDQSGSMVDAMVNCTILASIFAGLPKVDCHLIAFDTEVLDLTPWVHDPFEVLLRTNLGGGNDGPKAMALAQTKIIDPRNTVMVWISDFYEFSNDQPLFQMIKVVKESGVSFLPVGSVSSSGYFNVNPWFRTQFKQLGTPLVSGSLKTLIRELKTALPG
ncbi:vWA domain-containing protein [Haliangium sp.]|uniref:vWA domain-containing protein n=1 Tax=Haliangium sp. TaxID=2663208 RepID=UPI003D0E6DDE